MKIGRVTPASGNVVDGGVDKSDCWPRAGDGLLIHEGSKAGPERGGTTGASDCVVAAAIVSDIDVISHPGNVRDVTHGGGPMVGRHAETLLPGRNGVARADPATAAHAATPIPDRFRDVAGARARGQRGPAHLGDVGALGGEVDGSGRGAKRVRIPGSVKEGLPLDGHLLENGLGGRVGTASTPRATELLDGGVRDHNAKQVFPGAGIGSFKDVDRGQAGSHGHRHFNIQADFAIAVAGVTDSAIHRHVDQGNVRQAKLGSVGRNIADIVAIKLKQADALSCAG